MQQTVVDWAEPKIGELVILLEEILREERKTKAPLYKFIDLGYVKQLTSKRNHVIFGKRGSGKSVLLRELQAVDSDSAFHSILVDVQAIAQKSYSSILVETLLIVFRALLKGVRLGFFARMFSRRKAKLARDIEQVVNDLEEFHSRPDEVPQETIDRQKGAEEYGLELRKGINLTASDSIENEQTVKEQGTWKKIEKLSNSITGYRDLIERWLDLMEYRSLYILLDDYYQIDLNDQPHIADFLKRLFHGVPCFLKIATLPSRSRLFVKDASKEAGLQAEDDYTRISLDPTLDDFSTARDFLSTILSNLCQQKIDPLRADDLFESGSSEAMGVFTEASGGNPRDFFHLLRIAIQRKRASQAKTPISEQDIRAAITTYYNSFKRETETSFMNFSPVDVILKKIISLCRSHNDIGFFIVRREIQIHPAIESIITLLRDNRFIHLLTHAYGVPASEDEPAFAYLLSMGLYNEYAPTLSLLRRKLNDAPYPRLHLDELSTGLSILAPDLALLPEAVE